MGLEARSTGLKVQARHKWRGEMPSRPPGEHLWVVVGAWTVDPTQQGDVHLDLENLRTLEGPGCYYCELPWSEALANQPCKGTR